MHRICKNKADTPTTKIAKAIEAKQIPIVPRSYARSENQLVVQVANPDSIMERVIGIIKVELFPVRIRNTQHSSRIVAIVTKASDTSDTAMFVVCMHYAVWV